MGFKPAPGIKGRVFIPAETPAAHKKHACPDCYQCQLCSEDRCQLCRTAGECHDAPKIGQGIHSDHGDRPQTVTEGQ